jgi:hypothetical protein
VVALIEIVYFSENRIQISLTSYKDLITTIKTLSGVKYA